jgi:hypothetical protein
LSRLIEILCINCNEKAFVDSQSKGKYCSHKCQHEYQSKQYIERWLMGLETGNQFDTKVSPTVRRYLIELYGNKCQLCEWNKIHPVTGKVPIQIDHIDGDATNSQLNNLQLLCPNCHSLTSTYGALNKGNGKRYNRKEWQRIIPESKVNMP